MSRHNLSKEINLYLDVIFLTGHGPNLAMVQGFIDQHSPLEADTSDAKREDHLLAIHGDVAKDYEVRVVATYLLRDVCGHFIDLPDKD